MCAAAKSAVYLLESILFTSTLLSRKNSITYLSLFAAASTIVLYDPSYNTPVNALACSGLLISYFAPFDSSSSTIFLFFKYAAYKSGVYVI